MSKYFSTSNGVKQGGVLSPIHIFIVPGYIPNEAVFEKFKLKS